MKRIITTLLMAMAVTVSWAQTIVTSDTLVTSASSNPKFRISLQGGLSYRLVAIDKSLGQDLIDYQKKMKIGYNDSAEISYFLPSLPGNCIGLKYTHMKSSVSAYGTFIMEDGTTKDGTLADNVTILFIGPYYGVSTAVSGNKNIIGLNAGAGYVGYTDKACMITPYTLSGWTLGYYLGFQYDHMITDHIAVGAELSVITGVVSDINKTESGTTTKLELETGQGEGVVHLDASVGLRFYL